MKRLYCFALLGAIGSFFSTLPTKYTGAELILQRLTSEPIVQVKKDVIKWYERVQDIVAVLNDKDKAIFGGRDQAILKQAFDLKEEYENKRVAPVRAIQDEPEEEELLRAGREQFGSREEDLLNGSYKAISDKYDDLHRAKSYGGIIGYEFILKAGKSAYAATILDYIDKVVQMREFVGRYGDKGTQRECWSYNVYRDVASKFSGKNPITITRVDKKIGTHKEYDNWKIK